MAAQDRTPYQDAIIKRYYRNHSGIQLQRLAELATELYLATGKKQERLWTQVGEILARLELPTSRIEHVTTKRDPALVAMLVKELEGMAS